MFSTDGWGWGRRERERETEGCMDDPAKRKQVKVASCLQELPHKTPLSSFLSAFLIINFLQALEEADWPVPFQKAVASLSKAKHSEQPSGSGV